MEPQARLYRERISYEALLLHCLDRAHAARLQSAVAYGRAVDGLYYLLLPELREEVDRAVEEAAKLYEKRLEEIDDQDFHVNERRLACYVEFKDETLRAIIDVLAKHRLLLRETSPVLVGEA